MLHTESLFLCDTGNNKIYPAISCKKGENMKNGLEDYYVIRGNKKMRFGYTTGSCAAAACKGAAEMLLSGQKLETVSVMCLRC